VAEGLVLARGIMHKIDEINASTADEDKRLQRYLELKAEVERVKRSMVHVKRELRTPGEAGVRVKGVLKYLLRRMKLIR
jgi:hypothetical protein